jgi:hypothetical protein
MTERHSSITEAVQPSAGEVTDERQLRDQAVAPALGEISLQSRTVLAVKAGEDSIRIGQKKMPYTARRDAADYTDYRYRFFRVLTEHQSGSAAEPHQELTPREVWALMGEGGKLDKEVMNAIKKWLPSISYHRQPLVVSTGKRGRGSRYAVNPNFFLDVQERRTTAPAPRALPDTTEVYEAVRHLTQFDFAIREYGVLQLDPELEMSLQEHRPDYSLLRAEGQELSDFKAEALSKLDQLLSDQDYIARYKSSLNKQAPEYGLLRYIYDLTPNERFFVRRLIKAKVEPVTTAGELRLEAVDENGMLISFISPSSVEKEPQERQNDKGDTKEINISEVIYDSRQAGDSTAEGEVSLRGERLESLLEVIEVIASDAAATFLVNFNAAKTYRLAQVQTAFPKLTTNKLVSAKTNNIINNVKDQPLSIEDVVRIILHSDPYLRNAFTTRKYKERINAIIQRVIDENVERVEQELRGESEEF